MGNLVNAPLIEVVLELRWQITNKDDLSRIQYLYGDIYSELKNKYPIRETIQPVEIPVEVLINNPVHRYRALEKGYPLIQIGPGILTLNMDKSSYSWDSFLESSKELIKSFLKIFPFQTHEYLAPSLLFLDFFPFNFENNDVYEYVNDQFNISFSQSFLEKESNPKNINFGYYYQVPLGDLSVIFMRGKNLVQNDGIVLQTRINGLPSVAEPDHLNRWIEQSHDVCSDIFKKLTSGILYESFNK